MSESLVLPADMRYNNVLEATSAVVCPRHQVAHKWRVIDFDYAYRIEDRSEYNQSYMRSIYRKIYPKNVFFWGDDE